MTSSPLSTTTAIVLAAGQGTRMKSNEPKVLHEVCGLPMVGHVRKTLEGAGVNAIVGVVGPDAAAVAEVFAPFPTAIQTDRLGTAHAVLAARDHLTSGQDILVMFGDTVLITPETIKRLAEARQTSPAPGVIVLGFEPDDPSPYGRLIVNQEGQLTAIVEALDATEEQRTGTLCNSGVMLIDGAKALSWLDRIGNQNAKGEYYLTNIVAIAIADGATCGVVTGDAREMAGVNDRIELAEAEAVMQDRLRRSAMAGGVTMTDPASVFLNWDTEFGQDVRIGPNVVFGPGVTIADNVEIRAFCHLEGAHVAEGSVIGPYARLRPGADIGEGAKIGNFVEVKNATFGAGAKANHLTYVGDAEVGPGANIGAGTITCNYDGYFKSRTVIGEGAFIGSNTALVAPVTVGKGAIVGAGSTLSKNVAADALAVTRADMRQVTGWAKRFNTAQAEKKKQQKK